MMFLFFPKSNSWFALYKKIFVCLFLFSFSAEFSVFNVVGCHSYVCVFGIDVDFEIYYVFVDESPPCIV